MICSVATIVCILGTVHASVSRDCKLSRLVPFNAIIVIVVVIIIIPAIIIAIIIIVVAMDVTVISSSSCCCYCCYYCKVPCKCPPPLKHTFLRKVGGGRLLGILPFVQSIIQSLKVQVNTKRLEFKQKSYLFQF